MENFETLLNQFERKLPKIFPGESFLHRSARYVLSGGGKRVRPRLFFATLRALGSDPEAFIEPACALELIHTYSLIHDDLPCMDDDAYRRGKPTLHTLHDEAHALLVGDFLLTLPFEQLAKTASLSADQRLALIETLSNRAGGQGMIKGQLLDLEGKDNPLSENELLEMHEKKTGALFLASVEFAAICNKSPLAELHPLGQSFGLLFQLLDDLQDIEEDSNNSFVKAEGLEKTRSHLTKLETKTREAISKLPGNGDWLKELLNQILSSQKNHCLV